jgi:hypothetical protein
MVMLLRKVTVFSSTFGIAMLTFFFIVILIQHLKLILTLQR